MHSARRRARLSDEVLLEVLRSPSERERQVSGRQEQLVPTQRGHRSILIQADVPLARFSFNLGIEAAQPALTRAMLALGHPRRALPAWAKQVPVYVFGSRRCAVLRAGGGLALVSAGQAQASEARSTTTV